MADPTNITMEVKPAGIAFTGNLLQGRDAYLAKFNDYMPMLMGLGVDEYVHMKPLNGAVEIGRLFPSNIVSSPPFGTALDLYTWLVGFFGSASSTTLSVLLADLQNGNAPAGKWVFVSDAFTEIGEGLWLFCTSATSIAKNGFGLGLACDWASESTYEPTYSGNDCSGTNFGQWRPQTGSFLIPHGAVTGTFEQGEAISTPTWEGIFCYDSIGGIVAYTTGGSDFAPTETEIITGGTSGATTEAGVAGDNQLYGGGVVCHLDGVTGIYEHYLCIDPKHLLPGSPDSLPDTWLRLPRTTPNSGYVKQVWEVEYDIYGIDDLWGGGWTESINDGYNRWRMTEDDTRNVFLLTSSRPLTFPWGAKNGAPGSFVHNISGIDANGNLELGNAGDLEIHGISVGDRGSLRLSGSRKSSASGITVEAGASAILQVPAQLDDSSPGNGYSLSNITVRAGRTFTGIFSKSVGDFIVTGDASVTQSYAPFTATGLRRFAKVFTVADLTTAGGFDVTPGILFFTPPADTSPVGRVFLQKTHAGAPFGMSADLVLRVDNGGSGNVAGRYSNGLLTSAADSQLSLPFPQLTSGASSKAAEAPWGSNIYLSSFTGSVLATGGGTSTLTVVLEYELITRTIV